MFRRRVPPNIVFVLSVLLALVCGVVAYRAYSGGSMIAAIVFAVFCVWFGIDAVRSLQWIKRK